MKGKRTPLIVKDFSGGQNTNPSQTDVDSKYSPDCLNVYAEGPTLRKRFGFAHINSASAGTMGNGIYNWVLSATQQYLVALFDNTLKQMSVSGTSWSGNWTTISANSAGTNFSNAIMHFITYQGTLIMTTEARDKAQRMTPTDTTYKNLETGGTGISPLAKYPQVWKEHVFLLNISGGGQLTEDCGSLANWTTLDIANGATTTSTFGGLQNFKFSAGLAAGSDAHIKRTLSNLTTSYSVEIKTYFSALSAITGGDYAYMDIANGVIRFRTRWSQGGLETFNGTTWLQIGVSLVTTGTWNTWKYLVSAGTAANATVDVFKDGAAVGLQFSVANASAASSGQIDLACNAGGSLSTGLWYMDYIYVNPIASRTNYFTDGLFASWVSSSQASYTDNVLPTIPYLHYKCNDNAASAVVTDSGSLGSNGLFLAGATTINTSLISVVGKIGQAFSFTSASSHYVSLSTGFINVVKSDTTGGMAFWFNASTVGGILISFSGATAQERFTIFNNTANQISVGFVAANLDIFACLCATTFNLGQWNHCAISQNGTAGLNIYINGSLGTTTYSISNNKAAWNSSLNTFDTASIGVLRDNNIALSYYTGNIDDFRYYRTVLSSSDVQSIYAEGNGNEGHPVTVREGTTIYTGTFSYRVNNDGQYAVVSQTLTSSAGIAGTSLILGAFINATNLSTYKLRVNDGTTNYDSAILTANGTWQYQTLNFTPVSNSTAVRAQVISLSSNTIYIDSVGIVPSSTGVTQDFSDRLQRSVSGTYDTWTGGDSGTNDITTPGDVGLTGSFILQDRMYVTKAWNIYRITYTASIPLLDIKNALSVVGTKSPRATKNLDIPGTGEVVIFFGTDRNLYLFDGFSLTNLSDDIQLNNGLSQVYMSNVNTQALDKVFAVNHSNIGCYEIFLPIGNATVPNYSLFYNYLTKSFWPFGNRNFTSGNVSDNGAGERVVMVVGATNGITYEINTDQHVDDDGLAINNYWTSFKLGEDYILGKDDEIRLATDAVQVTPTLQWRTNYETAYASTVLPANTNSHVFDPKRIGNLFQFKISDNSRDIAWKVWHVKVLEKALGIGG